MVAQFNPMFFSLLLMVLFIVMQHLIIFKCIGVSYKPRQCALINIVYLLIFKGTYFYMGHLPELAYSSELQIMQIAIHMTNTFILLAIIAIYCDGYLPRNILIVSFYYDLIYSIPFMPHKLVSVYFIEKYQLSKLPNYLVTSTGAAIDLISFVLYFLAVLILIKYFNGVLKRLTSKIPDRICLLLMIFMLTTSLFKIFLLNDSQIYTTAQRHEIDPFFSNAVALANLLVVILALLCYLMLSKTFVSRRYKKIQQLDNSLLLDYYSNISSIHMDIRMLKHDLKNHMLAVSSDNYIKSLSEACDAIQDKLDTWNAWENIETEILSAREKYEIHQYVHSVIKKLHIQTFELINDGNNFKYVFYGKDVKKLKPALLRQTAMYSLINTLVQYHGGSTKWEKGIDTCTFTIYLQH